MEEPIITLDTTENVPYLGESVVTSGYIYVKPRICENCKFWDAPDERFMFGDCQRVVNHSPYARVEGNGKLITAKDFGCVLFEESEVKGAE